MCIKSTDRRAPKSTSTESEAALGALFFSETHPETQPKRLLLRNLISENPHLKWLFGVLEDLKSIINKSLFISEIRFLLPSSQGAIVLNAANIGQSTSNN
jgi:hypothetical protein